MRRARLSWAGLVLLLLAGCETTPAPAPATAAPAVKVRYDARILGRAIRRVDALAAQGRTDELKADQIGRAHV